MLKVLVLSISIGIIIMNIPRFLFIASFAWLSSLAVIYVVKRFIFPPAGPIEQITLNRSIDFDCEPQDIKATTTIVESPLATWTFSTHGASLEQLTYKREQQDGATLLPVMQEVADHEREKRAFLVALDGKTPYYYQLKSVTEDTAKAVITYTATSAHATIEKIYTVHKDSFQLDVALKIIPASAQETSARIFLPVPHLKDLGADDIMQAVVQDKQGSLQKIQRSSINTDSLWHPALIGVEDKFFANVLFKDSNAFVQHGFFHVVGSRELYAIVHGPTVAKATEWHMSFYVGPKEEKALASVDKHLEGLLEYSGILAPISKILLKILNWLYAYVHNYGWAIIILTLVINLVLLPLNIKSLKSAKKSTEFHKKLEYLKQRYKNDPEAYAREQADLIAKHGMPLIGGCLPKLLQLPIFFALSRVLSNSLPLYKAPFMGWIHDLSASDPYYILPLLLILTMLVQAPSGDIKQRFIIIAFALMFGTAALGFSAGLCLYMIVGLGLNVMQNFMTQKLKWL